MAAVYEIKGGRNNMIDCKQKTGLEPKQKPEW